MKFSILALFFVVASGTQAQAVAHLSQEVRIIDPLPFIASLASKYGKNQRVTSLLKNVQVYIMPSMNPDGAAHLFKLSANFHGGAEVVNYPWDTQAKPFPLDNLVKKLSLDYSKKVPYIYNSIQFKEEITNGYAWYEVDRGMQDWSYHWHHDLQLTIELTQVKWPAYSSIRDSYLSNRDALLTLIEDIAQV